MIGSLVSAGVGAAASIFGGITASNAMNKVKANLEQQKKANQDWYDRRYNEDATQRADAQRILTKTEEAFRTRNKQAQAAAAVMGGTEESIASTKAANSQALADATSQIAVNADARKDQIEQTFQQNDRDIQSQLNALEERKAAAIGQAAQGVANSASSLGKAF